MKVRKLASALFITVLLWGCSSTKFTEYHGTQGLVGPVGTARAVDGIDFWENGIPGRKFTILGTINQSRKQRLPLGRLTRIFSGSGDSDDDKASAIAKIAHKYGGDAVILVIGGQEPSDAGESGHGKHQRFTLVVAKYVE